MHTLCGKFAFSCNALPMSSVTMQWAIVLGEPDQRCPRPQISRAVAFLLLLNIYAGFPACNQLQMSIDIHGCSSKHVR